MKRKIFLACVIGSLVAGTSIFAEEGKDRVQSSINVFSKGLDQLLIDTTHVYVNPSETVRGFQLPETGVIFIGRIALTSSGEIRVIMQGAVSGEAGTCLDSEIDLKDLDAELKNLDVELKSLSTELGDLKDLDIKSSADLSKLSALSKLSCLSKLSKLSNLATMAEVTESPDGSTKVIKIRRQADSAPADKERLEKMDEHVTAFKKELAEAMVQYAPILKGLENGDRVCAVFEVKDKEFKEKYGVSNLIAQIAFKKLLKLQEVKSTDPDFLKQFEFNL
jgi:hypothetical protein